MCSRLPKLLLSMVVFSFITFSALSVFTDFGFVKQAVAQEADKSGDEEVIIDEGDPKAAALAKAQMEALSGQVRNVTKNLGQAEYTHFGIIYGNYNIYSTVKAVREDVEKAVNACKENNPDMADRIDTRWGSWTKSVDANMKEAWANINSMTMAQDYASQDSMKNIFALVDETRKANSSRFEKIPVSTPEACEFMLSKMDETQDNMNMMLIATIRSYPEIMKAMQE